MNKHLNELQPYPFEKLAKLMAGVVASEHLNHISLSIGEPKHPAPQFVVEAYCQAAASLSSYPLTRGLPELRQAICAWLERRFRLPQASLDPESQALPVNGTREALFAFIQATINTGKPATVLMPNPCYQIYEGAALLSGAQPTYLDCLPENQYQPDYDSVTAETWADCQVLFICSPGNPSGAVTDITTLQKLIALADEYNFVIASDECYSEIYFAEDQPPPGLLEAAAAMGNTDYRNCVVFHSLSKRSNLPGMRSGFVAGDANIIADFFRYRTYHGCAMPFNVQHASIAAWQDESHVIENRNLYRQKFETFKAVIGDRLPINIPAGSFYLWPQTPISDQQFARQLKEQQNITCLPGSFLGRSNPKNNPGDNHVRMALVAPLAECREAAERIAAFVDSL